MYKTLDDLEKNIENNQGNLIKQKKRYKWILIVIGLIVGFLVLLGFTIFIMQYFTLSFFSDTLLIIVRIFSILIALFSEISIIYLILIWRIRKSGGKHKTIKILKIILFMILPLLILSAFLFFIKRGTIHNWFNIDFLNVEQCGPERIYSWKSDNCYQKCINGCAYKDCASATMPFEQDCSSDCHEMCDIPKYRNCMLNCKKPDVEGYSEEDYRLRCKKLCENLQNDGLTQKEYYSEWIDPRPTLN